MMGVCEAVETRLERKPRPERVVEKLKFVSTSPFGFIVSAIGLGIQAGFMTLLVTQVDVDWSYLIPTRLVYDGHGPANLAGIVLYSLIGVVLLIVGFYGAWRLRSGYNRRVWTGAAFVSGSSAISVVLTDSSMGLFRGSGMGVFLGMLIGITGVAIGLLTIRRVVTVSLLG
jgi:hypothetical protein